MDLWAQNKPNKNRPRDLGQVASSFGAPRDLSPKTFIFHIKLCRCRNNKESASFFLFLFLFFFAGGPVSSSDIPYIIQVRTFITRILHTHISPCCGYCLAEGGPRFLPAAILIARLSKLVVCVLLTTNTQTTTLLQHNLSSSAEAKKEPHPTPQRRGDLGIASGNNTIRRSQTRQRRRSKNGVQVLVPHGGPVNAAAWNRTKRVERKEEERNRIIKRRHPAESYIVHTNISVVVSALSPTTAVLRKSEIHCLFLCQLVPSTQTPTPFPNWKI